MTVFDDAIRLAARGNGRYEGAATHEWTVYLGPNGGYLAAVILNAQMQELGTTDRHPRSLAVHFADRAVEGPLEVEVAIERVGRSFTSTTARLTQEGRLCATSHCVFAAVREGTSYDDAGVPDVPAPEDATGTAVPPEVLPRFAQNFDYLACVGNVPYSESAEAVLGGWIRSKEPRPVDGPLLATYADAFAPAIFTKLSAPIIAPTIDLTVHFLTDLPLEHDWVLCRFDAPVGRDGVLIEDGWMWDRNGNVLARSRQLALFSF